MCGVQMPKSNFPCRYNFIKEEALKKCESQKIELNLSEMSEVWLKRYFESNAAVKISSTNQDKLHNTLLMLTPLRKSVMRMESTMKHLIISTRNKGSRRDAKVRKSSNMIDPLIPFFPRLMLDETLRID